MKGPKHHSCRKGTPIHVKMRDGSELWARFDQETKRGFKAHGVDGEILWRHVRSWRVLRADER